MRQILKYTGYILVMLIVLFLIWKFYYIIGWLLIAAVISFVGEPLVRFFDRVRIGRFHIPRAMSTVLTLLVILLFMLSLVGVLVPLIITEADAIAKIDISKVGENLQGPIQWIDTQLHSMGTIPEDQSLQDYISARISTLLSFRNLSTFLGGFFSTAGSFFLGFFAILFISFFFLKDENMFEEGVLLIVPVKHHEATRKVITDSKYLLKRYFIGVLVELISVITLISLGAWILGVKNALLIGFFGGIMNIIPYIGPVLGSVLGISIGLTGTLAAGEYNQMVPVLIKLLSVTLVVQFIDNNILVPTIYSKSVKSHPLEIFLIIIMGGGLAGFPGMLLAVPVYTVLRVIAKEFLQEFRLIQKMTEVME
jgi:predicted PurR-regulated permease PerM